MRHGVLGLFSLGHLDFVILSSFVIGHSSLISINRFPSMQPPCKGDYPDRVPNFALRNSDLFVPGSFPAVRKLCPVRFPFLPVCFLLLEEGNEVSARAEIV